MINIEKIKDYIKQLGEKAPRIIGYEITDSTNTRAKEYALSDSDRSNTVAFIADAQSAGRGRLGRRFVSEAGAGLYISILSYKKADSALITKATAAAAVALKRAICSLCEAQPMIKWVNDLYLDEKKLAGILCECELDATSGKWRLICGMGINVYKNAINSEISDIATSLEDSGEKIERELLAARLIIEYARAIELIESEELLSEYRESSLILGKKVKVIPIGKEPYTATAMAVNDDFSLEIVLENGESQRLFSGEVSTKII